MGILLLYILRFFVYALWHNSYPQPLLFKNRPYCRESNAFTIMPYLPRMRLCCIAPRCHERGEYIVETTPRWRGSSGCTLGGRQNNATIQKDGKRVFDVGGLLGLKRNKHNTNKYSSQTELDNCFRTILTSGDRQMVHRARQRCKFSVLH